MANRSSEQRYVKQIRASTLLPQVVVEQRCAMMQSGELPDELQQSCELELARAPNFRQSTLHTSLTYLENEKTIFQRCVGNTFIAYKTNPFDNFNIYLGGRQAIEIAQAFHSLNGHIERSHSFHKIFQSIYSYSELGLNLAIGHVKYWLRTTVAGIYMA